MKKFYTKNNKNEDVWVTKEKALELIKSGKKTKSDFIVVEDSTPEPIKTITPQEILEWGEMEEKIRARDEATRADLIKRYPIGSALGPNTINAIVQETNRPWAAIKDFLTIPTRGVVGGLGGALSSGAEYFNRVPLHLNQVSGGDSTGVIATPDTSAVLPPVDVGEHFRSNIGIYQGDPNNNIIQDIATDPTLIPSMAITKIPNPFKFGSRIGGIAGDIIYRSALQSGLQSGNAAIENQLGTTYIDPTKAALFGGASELGGRVVSHALDPVGVLRPEISTYKEYPGVFENRHLTESARPVAREVSMGALGLGPFGLGRKAVGAHYKKIAEDAFRKARNIEGDILYRQQGAISAKKDLDRAIEAEKSYRSRMANMSSRDIETELTKLRSSRDKYLSVDPDTDVSEIISTINYLESQKPIAALKEEISAIDRDISRYSSMGEDVTSLSKDRDIKEEKLFRLREETPNLPIPKTDALLSKLDQYRAASNKAYPILKNGTPYSYDDLLSDLHTKFATGRYGYNMSLEEVARNVNELYWRKTIPNKSNLTLGDIEAVQPYVAEEAYRPKPLNPLGDNLDKRELGVLLDKTLRDLKYTPRGTVTEAGFTIEPSSVGYTPEQAKKIDLFLAKARESFKKGSQAETVEDVLSKAEKGGGFYELPKKAAAVAGNIGHAAGKKGVIAPVITTTIPSVSGDNVDVGTMKRHIAGKMEEYAKAGKKLPEGITPRWLDYADPKQLYQVYSTLK